MNLNTVKSLPYLEPAHFRWWGFGRQVCWEGRRIISRKGRADADEMVIYSAGKVTIFEMVSWNGDALIWTPHSRKIFDGLVPSAWAIRVERMEPKRDTLILVKLTSFQSS